VNKTQTARLWWGLLAGVTAASLVLELIAQLLNPQPGAGPAGTVLRYATYFTIQSNFLVFLTALPLARDPRHDSPRWRVLRLDSLLGITVTGVVFALLLAGVYKPQGISYWTNIGLHYIAPPMAVLGWAIFGPWGGIGRATVGWGLLWPMAWIAWTLGQGTFTAWYPYPFLDVNQLGYAVALRNVGLVVLFAFTLLVALSAVDRRRMRAHRG
jgi:hypothetical protein